MQLARHINSFRAWQRFAALRFECTFVRDHDHMPLLRSRQAGRSERFPSPALPGSGSTGLRRSRASTLSLRAPGDRLAPL